ncbi:MAG: ppGpp synthetase/RelA/SpoT-type nucleotidyltransferase [Lentimonas sp.]|jgi:ppGpp synthetase/RelA/SpoT-type nucleotidyltranferase
MNFTMKQNNNVAWNEISEDQLESGVDWSNIYEQVNPLLILTDRIVISELKKFRKKSHAEGSFSVRIKDGNKFAKKMKSKLAKSNADSIFKKAQEVRKKIAINLDMKPVPVVSVFDIVNDLVGGRQIFHFESDIQEAVIFWLSCPIYQPIEVVTWKNPDLSNIDRKGVALSWVAALNKDREIRDGENVARETSKDSGYESVHFILQFNPSLLKASLFSRNGPAEGKDLLISKEDLFKHDIFIGLKNTEGLEERGFMKYINSLCDDQDMVNIDYLVNDLASVKFEIQCRTTLEHIWAEIEHKANYKSNCNVGNDTSRDFRLYKSMLVSAQNFQNTLRPGMHIWDAGEMIFNRSTNISIGKRNMWDSKSNKEIFDGIENVRSCLQKITDGGCKRGDINWNNATVLVSNLFNIMDKDESCSCYVDAKMTAEKYKKIRLPLLFLAFLLAYRPREQLNLQNATTAQEMLVAVQTSLSEDKWIVDLIGSLQNISNNGSGRCGIENNLMPIIGRPELAIPYAYVVAIRLYESILIFDEYYRDEDNKKECILHDPLILTRCASIYYRHYGSLSQSTAFYEKAVEMLDGGELAVIPRNEQSHVLAPAYLHKRIAENYWIKFHTGGCKIDDLDEAIISIEKAFNALYEASKKESEINLKKDFNEADDENEKKKKKDIINIREKLIAFTININFYNIIFADENGGDVGGNWELLEKLYSSVVAVVDNEEYLQAFLISGSGKTLRKRARALFWAMEAYRSKNKTLAEVDECLQKARVEIKKSYNETQKGYNKNYIIKPYLDVTKRIKNYISSLDSEDLFPKEKEVLESSVA